jgi:hypothetical protein
MTSELDGPTGATDLQIHSVTVGIVSGESQKACPLSETPT